ncbi:MAG: Crp/Fnr family transcriptional regulator [Bacteroidota bacterium]|nr:Crp/Fnr family transcriptional regulator [Bacteroidota bacterium]
MKNTKYRCDLNTCMLCKFCIHDWKPVIEAKKKNIYIKKGQKVFAEGDPVNGIYFVYEGSIKVHQKWDREKELILRFAKKGDILGHLGLGTEAVYPVSATAVDTALICYIDMELFESTLNINSDVAIRLMRFFAGELQSSEKRMRNLAHMPVKGRVAQMIVSLKNQFGVNDQGAINIEVAKQDLASFAGVAYESLFRTLNNLSDEGMIGLSGKAIFVKDETRLLQLVAEQD